MALKFFTATIRVTHSAGATVTCELDSIKYTAPYIAPDISRLWTVTVHKPGSWQIEATQKGREHMAEVVIAEDGEEKSVIVSTAPRYGYRKTKKEGNPTTRITYLYEADGLKPAGMKYDEDKFDYGDWMIHLLPAVSAAHKRPKHRKAAAGSYLRPVCATPILRSGYCGNLCRDLPRDIECNSHLSVGSLRIFVSFSITDAIIKFVAIG